MRRGTPESKVLQKPDFVVSQPFLSRRFWASPTFFSFLTVFFDPPKFSIDPKPPQFQFLYTGSDTPGRPCKDQERVLLSKVPSFDVLCRSHKRNNKSNNKRKPDEKSPNLKEKSPMTRSWNLETNLWSDTRQTTQNKTIRT